jgi:hypothetical protein
MVYALATGRLCSEDFRLANANRANLEKWSKLLSVPVTPDQGMVHYFNILIFLYVFTFLVYQTLSTMGESSTLPDYDVQNGESSNMPLPQASNPNLVKKPKTS